MILCAIRNHKDNIKAAAKVKTRIKNTLWSCVIRKTHNTKQFYFLYASEKN